MTPIGKKLFFLNYLIFIVPDMQNNGKLYTHKNDFAESKN